MQQYSSPEQMDGFLISYPKSGRTWLQRIMVEAAMEVYQIKGPVKDIYDLQSHIPAFPKIVSTHAGSCWEEKLRIWDDQEIGRLDDKAFLQKKVVHMIRDPRDVLVSQYYHMKFRTNISSIQKKHLIESRIIGLKKQIAFLNKWQQYGLTYPKHVLLVSYEELQEAPLPILVEIADFWKLGLSKEALEKGKERAAFNRMRAKENAKTLTPWNYTPQTSNRHSYHARSGKTGEYHSFFSEAEKERINQILINNLNQAYQKRWL